MTLQPPPDKADPARGTAGWRLRVAARGGGDGHGHGAARLGRRSGRPRAPLRAGPWGGDPRADRLALVGPLGGVARPRLPAAVDQALADLAALRIVDGAHPDRAVVAAGAPWFMTLFGRDSLLTAWMTLPFDGSLAGGVLGQPGRSPGHRGRPGVRGAARSHPARTAAPSGSGRFSSRSRITARWTPRRSSSGSPRKPGGGGRWARTPSGLAPTSGAPSTLTGHGDSDGAGFLGYRRRGPRGLDNQGWKDSWDGVSQADGTLQPRPWPSWRCRATCTPPCKVRRSWPPLWTSATGRRPASARGEGAQGPV